MWQQEITNTVGNRYVLFGTCVALSATGRVYRAFSYKTKRAGFIAVCHHGDVSVYGPMVPVKDGYYVPAAERRTRDMAIDIAMKRAANCARNRWLARQAHSNTR